MINIKDLHIHFGDKKVLKGVNLHIDKNSIFGFVGKNGAGKTTTMKAILGLLSPNQGQIFIDGVEVTFGGEKTNKYIGYLPDVPEFYSFMTAYEFLFFCAQITKMDVAVIKERVEEMLRLVGLENEKHQIKGFSRGMKQRLGVAQALLNKPKLLICDEPTSALDPIGRKQILEILQNAAKETTILFSTHILGDVEKICTDVAVLDDGIIKVSGKLDAIKSIYQKNEYSIEFENKSDAMLVLDNFKNIKLLENCFYVDENSLHKILDFVVQNQLSLIKLEKVEPSLESLFMEVVQ